MTLSKNYDVDVLTNMQLWDLALEINSLADNIDLHVKWAMEDIGDEAVQILIKNQEEIPVQEDRIRVQAKNYVLKQHIGDDASVAILNGSKQATYAEFGYGIVGAGDPYPYAQIWGGESAIGWIGYDINSPYKMEDRSWKHKGVITYGAPNTPFFLKTYMYYVENLPRILSEKIVRGIT